VNLELAEQAQKMVTLVRRAPTRMSDTCANLDACHQHCERNFRPPTLAVRSLMRTCESFLAERCTYANAADGQRRRPEIALQVLMAGVQIGTVSDIRLAPAAPTSPSSCASSAIRDHREARFLIRAVGIFRAINMSRFWPTHNAGELFQDGDIAETEPPFNYAG